MCVCVCVCVCVLCVCVHACMRACVCIIHVLICNLYKVCFLLFVADRGSTVPATVIHSLSTEHQHPTVFLPAESSQLLPSHAITSDPHQNGSVTPRLVDTTTSPH